MKKEKDTHGLLADFVEFTKDQFKAQGDTLGKVERNISEIKEELRAIAKAVDKDAATVINHENRLARLEKMR